MFRQTTQMCDIGTTNRNSGIRRLITIVIIIIKSGQI